MDGRPTNIGKLDQVKVAPKGTKKWKSNYKEPNKKQKLNENQPRKKEERKQPIKKERQERLIYPRLWQKPSMKSLGRSPVKRRERDKVSPNS